MLLEIFRRAALGENLTPGERATRKLVMGLGAATLSLFFIGLPDMLKNGANWTAILSALGVALLLTLAKFFSASGQPALAGAASAGADKLADVGGISNDIVQELEDAASDANVPVENTPSTVSGV